MAAEALTIHFRSRDDFSSSAVAKTLGHCGRTAKRFQYPSAREFLYPEKHFVPLMPAN
jgi:hypothetical protein